MIVEVNGKKLYVKFPPIFFKLEVRSEKMKQIADIINFLGEKYKIAERNAIEMYQKYLDEKNPEAKKQYYVKFKFYENEMINLEKRITNYINILWDIYLRGGK